jgi:hypothetical protein
MTDTTSRVAARVAAHKARGKYVCATISPHAADALARIQHHYQCSQRAALGLALAAYGEHLPESSAMVTDD